MVFGEGRMGSHTQISKQRNGTAIPKGALHANRTRLCSATGTASHGGDGKDVHRGRVEQGWDGFHHVSSPNEDQQPKKQFHIVSFQLYSPG